jgi:rod shape determining protein RodA
MPGSILFTGVAMVVYFVVGIRYAEVYLSDSPTSVGKFAVMLLIQLFSIGMVWVYCNRRLAFRLLMAVAAVTLLSLPLLLIPMDIVYIQLASVVILVGYLVWEGLGTRLHNYYFIALFAIGSTGFYYGADFIMQNVLEHHQRSRINVLLGLDDDLRGAGYNVHQSEIAIGSGGLEGKGFLNGTQTKLKFVPEQDTDFIFCTVGEEEGFVGSAGVLLLFLALIWRLIYLSERQPFAFNRVYGYCVLSIFLFHVFINVGMVLGLTPVIGIPLPFFSYGGSSLWGFTFLLFIFLRLDASRNLSH